MNIFSKLYDLALTWAAHRHAQWYLSGLSFAESSFFPIPPDVMLAPMCLARPMNAWRYATITTVASVLGGFFGYLIGVFAFEFIEPVLKSLGYWDKFETVKAWFGEWGFWAILIAGFSPIPYKLFTIAAGVLGMPFLPFVLGSIIGRGGRFYLVAGVIVAGGDAMERMLKKYIDAIGWVLVAAATLAYLWWRFAH